MSAEEFTKNRSHLGSNAGELIRLAIDAQEELVYDPAIPLLTREGWIPPGPLDVIAVSVRWVGEVDDTPLRAAAERVRGYWPALPDGRRIDTLSGAIAEYARPAHFFNGASYRLLGVTPGERSIGFDVCAATYFDLLDTTEPLGYETAMLHRANAEQPMGGAYRRWLGDPFDLSRRCAIPGVDTLTVVVADGRPFFFMHKRTRVGTADGTFHVIPAGEFQPHSGKTYAHDMNIWHTIIREYAEELGGRSFAEFGDEAIDYSTVEPCASLDSSRRNGRGLGVWFLGVGLYPLTWKPEILTVCVFDAEVFGGIFPEAARSNEEGTIIGNFSSAAAYPGLPFRKDEVQKYTGSDSTLPAGRACLELAWRWRSELGIPDWT